MAINKGQLFLFFSLIFLKERKIYIKSKAQNLIWSHRNIMICSLSCRSEDICRKLFVFHQSCNDLRLSDLNKQMNLTGKKRERERRSLMRSHLLEENCHSNFGRLFYRPSIMMYQYSQLHILGLNVR